MIIGAVTVFTNQSRIGFGHRDDSIWFRLCHVKK